jgi:hypothetical protein
MVWDVLKSRMGDLRARQLMLTHMGPTMLAQIEDAKASGALIAVDGLTLDF